MDAATRARLLLARLSLTDRHTTDLRALAPHFDWQAPVDLAR